MFEDNLKAEADLRNAAMDRLIAASSNNDIPAFEETLERWRRVSLKTPDNTARELKSD